MVIHCQVLSSSLSVLPEDIVVQIVGRIYCIKTILRCTSVCKSWYTFITSTQFVQFYRDNNINIDERRRLLCEFSAFKAYCFSMHDDSENFHKYYSKTLKLAGDGCACDGLICYERYEEEPHSLYLWNPVIRKVKKLPDIDNFSSTHDHTQHSIFKLWFDRNEKDYKILKIVYKRTGASVHVYSLNTNSWKLITEDVDRDYTYAIRSLVYVNGTLYWPAHKYQKRILVSLDTKTWMFRETTTSFEALCWLYLAPSTEDDSLVILRYPRFDLREYFLANDYNTIDDRADVFDVYKYTTNELLSYSVNIGEDASRIDVDVGRHFDNGVLLRSPLGVRHNYDELLFDDNKTSRIFSYNIKTKKLTEFDLTRIGDNYLNVTPFVETLALLDDKDAYGSI